MNMGICLGRWRLGLGAGIAASIIAVTLSCCGSAPGELRIKSPNPVVPVDIEWKRQTPPGPGVPLPDGWTHEGLRPLCFEHKGLTFCPNICVATNPEDPECRYIKHGDCDEGGGWIKYCPAEISTNSFSMLAPAPDCTTTIGTVSHNPISGQTDVDVTVACTNWVDEDLVGVFIAHASTPGTFLDSNTFRSVYGDTMPAGSQVQFSGDMEETAWNTLLLKAERVEFLTTTGDDVVSVIVDAGNDIPRFAVTAVNFQIVDVRAIYDPR